MISFASDNYAPVLPQVMQALQDANAHHARSYGADDITARVTEQFRQVFGADVSVHYVFNGTGANVLSISSATHSYNAVLCADTSHIYNDESSAPETFTGCRFFPLPANEEGKLTPEIVSHRLIRAGDLHYPQTAMLSLTQSTEYGTVYTPAELQELSSLAQAHNLYLHIDGSRFFNAAASLGCSLKDISTDIGVDILSLGGTKAGMMYGEAVVVFNPALRQHIAYKHKQVMQLSSKNRFIAAQFGALLQDDLGINTAAHANAMAQQLYTALSAYSQIKVTRPVQANVVFAEIPQHWNEPLQAQFPFYVWKEHTNEVRLMCAWDTQLQDVEALVAAVDKLAK